MKRNLLGYLMSLFVLTLFMDCKKSKTDEPEPPAPSPPTGDSTVFQESFGQWK
ncbi:MAG TPA: hypothetical protein VJU78_08430 [Chitinophagaceae bacterium]|nr:hypothetical protein [Chitinophagaceae bacterium]